MTTDLPWRLFGRLIRPYALAVSLATLVYDSSGISATSEYYLNYVYVSAEM